MNGGGRCSTDTTPNTTNDVLPEVADNSIPDLYVPDPNCTCESCKEYATNLPGEDDGLDHDQHAAETEPVETENTNEPVVDIETTDVISSNNDSSFPADQLVIDESALADLLLRTDTEVDSTSEIASEINSSKF